MRKRRMVLETLLVVGTIASINGCATSGTDAKVHHSLELEIHSSIEEAKNIQYSYGEVFQDRKLSHAHAVSTFMNFTAPMRIPEFFDITWETMDGTIHVAKVPVKSKLPYFMSNKSVIFVVKQDHVEGYVGTWTGYLQSRKRFF